MSDAIGSKNKCETFSIEFCAWIPQSESSVEKSCPFFDCVRKPDLGFSRKRPFSTDKSDCVRNGLRIPDKKRFFFC